MRTTLSALLFLAVVSATPARAQDGGLTDLSLEDLLSTEVERVFGASRRLQPVTEAPASVTIVTGEDIQRLGYRTLADILRGVRSLYVTYDRNYSYLGVRGFAQPGDYNTRILLLVDGHRMNDNIYDQGGVGSEFGLDPALFERVEIIRGPSSSLYGTNAFFAVVNVITRTGASVNGMSTTAEAGSFGGRHVRTQAGRRLANGVDLFAAGAFTASAGPDRLYFADFDTPETNGGVSPATSTTSKSRKRSHGSASATSRCAGPLVDERKGYRRLHSAPYSTTRTSGPSMLVRLSTCSTTGPSRQRASTCAPTSTTTCMRAAIHTPGSTAARACRSTRTARTARGGVSTQSCRAHSPGASI